MRVGVSKGIAGLFLGLVVFAGAAAHGFGQTPSFLQTPAPTPATASAQPAVAADPLGRETPRGSLVGFIRTAQEENYPLAVEYFQPPIHGSHSTPEQEQELARQLLAILNTKFVGSLDSISNSPEGKLDPSVPPDHERVGGIRGLSESFPIYLVRLKDAQGRRLWFISRQTLEEVPASYDSLRFPQLEQDLPKFLVKHRPLGMPLWQWAAILLFAPIALALGRLITLFAGMGWRRFNQPKEETPILPEPWRRIGPATVMVAAILHFIFVNVISAPLLYRQYYQNAIWILLAFVFYWVLTRATRRISRTIWNRLTDSGRLAERSLVSLSRRVLDVLLFFVVMLIVLNSMGLNVTAALAGLGIGGLAIGLGAQKTFENLLGGIQILTDRALIVGDPCRIGDQRGVVEDIGLRSTKLRTEDRTVVSIPNGTVATTVLENYRLRDKILCRQTVRLRYDLAPDHIRYVIAQMQQVLLEHPRVEAGTSRVRLLKLGENAVEVELYAYILERGYAEFLAVQEELLLQTMEVIERTGAAVALPSQTTMVAQDKWVDPEKAAAAKKAMEKIRDPGVPGPAHPELAPDGGKGKA